MTVSSTDRRAGPFYGNGVTTEFPFTFKVFSADDLEITYTDADGAAAVLTSGFSVTLNADQDSNPGGTIEYPLSGSPMANPESLVAVGDLAYEQSTDITNGGRFRAQVIENALDYLAILIQQLHEQLERTITIPVDGPFPVTNLPNRAARYDRLMVFDAGTGQPNVSSFTQTQLASAIAAAYVGAAGPLDALSFLQSGTGAVSRTAQNKARESVTPQDFGAVADGVTVDVVAIRKAFAASKVVRFPRGTYNFGTINASGTLVDLTALGTGITMIVENGAEFICETTDNTVTVFFLLESNSHFTVVGCPRFYDAGYTGAASPFRGAVAFLLTNYTGHSWGNINIDAIYGRRILMPMLVNGVVSATNRIRGIRVGHIFADDCYYGVNCQEQGDGLHIGNITAYQCYRPYFVYGVSAHEVSLIYNRSPRSTSGAVNISRADGGLDTRGIKLHYVERENAAATSTAHILINHIGPSLGEISGIDISYDIEDTASNANPVRIVTYTAPGGVETNAVLGNVVDDIRITGRYVGAGPGNAVRCTATYTTPGRMDWGGGSGSTFDATIPDQFDLTDDSNYACTWSCASGAAPTLGNGTIVATYAIVRGMCRATIVFTYGSTSAPGGGVWQFLAPFAAKSFAQGTASIKDNGTAFFCGFATLAAGTQQIQVTSHSTVAAIQALVPITWATGDEVRIEIEYPL